MEAKNNIQEAMFREMREKSVFEHAQASAFQYIDEIFDRRVSPTQEALDNLRHFEEPLPEAPADAEAVINLLHQYGAPATSASLGGRYFGFVIGSSVPAGLAAKALATYWDQNTGLQVISPIAARLERVVEQWLKELLGLPERVVAGFVSGTSAANFCGLAAARYRLLKRLNWDVNEQGLFGAPKIRVVAGNHAHSTILKAIGLLGFGKNNVEWIDVDEQGRIRPEALPDLDDRTLLILQAGNVNSGSFDALDEICDRARQANAWVHIDGAFGLLANASDHLKHLVKGMEKADSWATDGHKTLNTPYDSGIVMCADPDALVAALHMTGGYIIHGDERDGMLYTPEMSRRGRIIELWATMKYLGRQGIAQLVDNLHERAVQFAGALRKMDGFEVLNDVVFNQVIVCCETDDLTAKTIARIQQHRTCWVGGSSWFGKKVIRISVCSWATTEEDIVRSAASFEKALQEAKTGVQTASAFDIS